MDATRKSEDEVCTALYDCDNDLDRAVNMLLEGEGQVSSLSKYFLLRLNRMIDFGAIN
jgi:hypothetical protein